MTGSMTWDRIDGREVWRGLSERQREVIGALAIEMVASWVGEGGRDALEQLDEARDVSVLEASPTTPDQIAHVSTGVVVTAQLIDAVGALVPEIDVDAGTAPIGAAAGRVCHSCGAVEHDLSNPVTFVRDDRCTRCDCSARPAGPALIDAPEPTATRH